ncbi:MAG TPA: DUF4142 domain-containing protein [Gemmatimonadaceae bacterium]|nr:DUF4142 domain-containing protein [Gemmatimonadaceae bacterium]
MRGRQVAAGALLAGALVGSGCRAGPDVRAAAAAPVREVPPDTLFDRIDATLTLAIAQGRLAAARATDPELRRFAADQVARYTALRTGLRATAYELGVGRPMATVALSRDLPLDTLRTARGAQFDGVYVRQALAVHRRLLGELDAALARVRDVQLRRALHELQATMTDPARTGDDAADGTSVRGASRRGE